MTISNDDAANGRLLLVLPLSIHRADGRWFIEMQAANGLRLWLKHFPAVTLVCPNPNSEVPDTSLAIEEVPGAERLEVVGLPASYSPMDFLGALHDASKVLGHHIDRSRYLHFAIGGLFGDWAELAALIAATRRRPFAVWTDHVESDVTMFNARSKRGMRRAYYSATAVAMRYYERFVIWRAHIGLFHGLDCYSAYARYNRRPHLVHDIHLGPDAQISPQDFAAKQRRDAAATPRIIYMGRVHREKGVFDWIEVLAIAAKRGAHFTARWFGAGPDLDEARAQVTRLGLSHAVAFPGPVSDRELVLEELRAHDVFLFCHKTLESPRCLIEALISATPIVGYETNYSTDLISANGGGVLTPRDDVHSLAAALLPLLADRARLAELAEKARADGGPFSDEAVFAHRSELMKSLPVFSRTR